jgi:NADH dehydrogenase
MGRMVAEELGFRLYSQELIHDVAEEAHVRDQLVESLDERVQDNISAWVSGLIKRGVFAPSDYLRTKAGGEQQIRVAQASGIRTTIFRPSVIFGREDRFLNLFARLAHALPVIALACPRARFQPVYVEDVARAMVESLELSRTYDEGFDLCGPAVYTLQELMEYVCKLLQMERPIVPLNDEMSHLQAWLMEWLPVKLMSRDNYHSMKVDSVCECAFPEVFGFRPSPLEAVVPLYLADNTPRSRYRWFRLRARR